MVTRIVFICVWCITCTASVVTNDAIVVANQSFTMAREDNYTGLIFVGDGNKVRVFDTSLSETQEQYELGPSLVKEYNQSSCRGPILNICQNEIANRITILELFYRQGNAHLFVCLNQQNGTCYTINTSNRSITLLTFSDNESRYLTVHPAKATGLVWNPSADDNADLYLCFGKDVERYTYYKQRLGITVLKVSLADRRITSISPIALQVRPTYTVEILDGIVHNFAAYYVLTYTIMGPQNVTLLQLTKINNTVHYVETSFRCGKDASKTQRISVDHFEDKLIVYAVSDSDTELCFASMDRVEEHLHSTRKECEVDDKGAGIRWIKDATFNACSDNSEMELLRSTSMLELDMTPWQFPVPQSQIDAFIVTTRLGSVVAYYTFNSTDEDRKFRRILLGANSDSYQWAETVRFGKQRVLDMWANERYLYVVGENQVRRFDTASCKHKTIADCNHDIECTWCGDLPGNCRQKDACATPANIVNMVNISVSGIQPDVGFVCGGSVVRLMGNNLDLADNISVEVQGKECEIIRDMSTKTSIEVRVPAYHSTGNSTLTVRLPGGRKPEVYPFTYLKCPHIIEPEGHAIKTIRSGGTKLQVSVGDIDGLKDSFFHIIEVAFLFNESVVATTHLRHVGKVDIPSFEFYFPPLVEYVGKRLNLALAAPTYHLIDRPRPTTVLYGSFSNLVVYVERDPIITGIHVGSETTNLLTVAYEARVGKIYLTGKDLETIGESDFHVVIEDVGNCKNIYIMRSNNRISCDLPWSKNFVGREVSYDIIVYIGRNLIYHPGKVRYMKSSRPLPSRLPTSTSKRTTTTTDQTSIPPIIKVDTSRSVQSSSLLLEILIPCLAVVFGFSACLFMYFRFRKHQGRRNIPDHDFPSVVSYRSNVGVFLGDTRPSFSFQTGSGDNSSMDAFINDSTEDSVRLIIKTMEDEELILKKRDLNIDQLIGRGNFGSVYKGHLSFGDDRKDIAVKTLQRDKPENMDITQFLKEAFVMKNFRHVNVMTLVGVCLDAGDMPLVVLPYMKHGDLLTYLQEERHIPTVKDLVCFGLDIALGMEYLASLKFVHRDLAARNCMLDVNFQVKVADFGLSRDVYETSYYSTRSKGVKLPVKWMSIESLSGGVFNEKTDVWSYGVTLWELMTRGVRPYAAVDNWDMEAYLKSGRRLPQPIYCPANFYKLMRKCWSADPDDRPSFSIVKDWISELLNRVHHYLGDLDQTTNIETTYVNLSMGNQCKYENLGNY